MSARSAREEMDELFDALLSTVQHLQAENGDFYPVGAWIAADGELSFAAGWDGSERPRPTEIVELLQGAMRQQANEGAIRAAAVAVDVLVVPPDSSKKTDAIMVSIEHAEADPVDVLVAYTKRRFGRTFDYGTTWAQEGTAVIFSSD